MYPIVDLVEHQTIGAVQAESDLEIALNGKVNLVFVMMGSILNVKSIIDRIKAAGKHPFLHMEFVEGIAPDRSGVAYIAQHIQPTGIISTRSNIIRIAKEMKLMTIQRVFLIDHNAVAKGIKMIEQTQPDAVEIMPGVMPRIISEVANLTPLPIIAGGLIDNQREIDSALEAGALAVSVGNSMFWGADD